MIQLVWVLNMFLVTTGTTNLEVVNTEKKEKVSRTPFSFIVFGDFNSGGCDRVERVLSNVTKMAAEPNIDFFICTGDIIDGYPEGAGTITCFGHDPVALVGADPCDGNIPDGNMADILDPLMSRTPKLGLSAAFYPVIGNHDDNWGSGWYPDPCGGGICDMLTYNVPSDYINHSHGDICNLNQGQSAHSADFYYSFVYQNNLFIVLKFNDDWSGMVGVCNGFPSGYDNCSSFCSDPAQFGTPEWLGWCYNARQYEWLYNTLQSAQGQYNHIFAFAHAPLVGSGDGHLPPVGDSPYIRELFDQFGVTAFFNGHNHAYQRSRRIKNGVLDETGTAYITVGTAGGQSDHGNDVNSWFNAATYHDWTFYSDDDYQSKMTVYMKITVDGNQVTGQTYSLGMDQIVDSFTYGESVSVVIEPSLWRQGLNVGHPNDMNQNGFWDVVDFIAIVNGGGGPISNAPVIAGCQVMPDENWWNTPIDQEPIHENSANFIASIGGTTSLHADFGTEWQGTELGIPYDIVPENQPTVSVDFLWPDESDAGPYPMPANPSIEGGSDNHILILQEGTCMLYELYAASVDGSGNWSAGSGAIWDMSADEVRPLGWTSADASGLPILPGLVRYDEVYTAGEINHALRVTMNTIRSAYVRPASHSDGTAGSSLDRVPMGARFRLHADFDISGFSEANQVILRALKKYGMFVADTGGDMYLSGTHHVDWDDDDLHGLQDVTAADFDVVFSGTVYPYP